MQFTGMHDGKVVVLYRMSGYSLISVLDTDGNRTGQVKSKGLGVGTPEGIKLDVVLEKAQKGGKLTPTERTQLIQKFRSAPTSIIKYVEDQSLLSLEDWEYFARGVERNPYALRYVKDLSVLPPSTWGNFSKALAEHPSSLLSIKDQSALPPEVWETFAKVLERAPLVLDTVKDQSVLPPLAFENFAQKLLVPSPSYISLIQDRSKLPPVAWDYFSRGLVRSPASLEHIKDQSGFPLEVWENFSRAIEGNPHFLSYIKDPKIRSYLEAKDLGGLRVYLRSGGTTKVARLCEHLDRIANDLESRGLKRLASEIDVVSNSIERMSPT
jgi:uncharacterized protein YwbE